MEELERKIEEVASNYADREIIVNEEKDENYATMIYAVKFGVKSEIAKQYWQQGMYSEEEVKQFVIAALKATGKTIKATMKNIRSNAYIEFNGDDFEEWFEQNKKK